MTTTYEYKVRDSLGNTLDGTIDAETAEEASNQLRRDGFEVLDIEEGQDTPLVARRISKKDIIFLTSQLSIMVDTGITLSSALSGILEQEENPTLRRVLKQLCESVESGEAFSTALAQHPKHFDQTFVSLVRASEATGTLGEMLERIAGYLRKDVETRGRVRAAMAYPLVMLVMAIGVTTFLLTYILPKFIPIFESRGTKLPAPTKIMMGVSHVLMGYWYLWLAGIILGVVGFIMAKRTDWGRQAWDWVKISLPLIGPTYRKVVISRCLRTLATMISSGVSIIDSLRLTSEVAGNYYYEQLWLQVLERVTGGRRINEALIGNALFPNVLVQMISSGEESGKLDYVLERVSNYYDQEVEVALKTTTSLIEPIMIAVMGVLVGGIGLALMLPVFSLSRPS
ncbi:MAG: type II secretion system F family protein [Pirellulales bacterium]|nr:type II secretion system F family protein [Pirellulales bacterium]